MHDVYVCMQLYICLLACVQLQSDDSVLCVCMHNYVCACTCVSCVCMPACMHSCMWVCMCVYVKDIVSHIAEVPIVL